MSTRGTSALAMTMLVVIATTSAGCAEAEPPKVPALTTSTAPMLIPAPTTPDAASTGAGEPREVLPFLHDDYPAALAEAKRTGHPIFIDAWAPWCHSCLSMRSYVLTDPSLAPLASQLVWLSIDTEKDSNAPFVAKFSNRVWPTLWVVEPAHETTLLRWEGTATAPELLTLLATVRNGDGKGSAQAVAFVEASRAALRGDQPAAEKGYRSILAVKDASERPRAVEALVGLLQHRKEFAGCTDLAVAELPSLPPGTSRATVLVLALSCARDAKREADLRTFVAAAEKLTADPDPRTLADDRSALFEELVETKKEQKDEAGQHATARAWATFLEGEAARAPSAQARAVFDPHRVEAYLAADEPARAVPMLQQSERDFPDDYNPPARLARAYLAMKQLDDAQAAVERASSRVYGPRSLRIFLLAADIAKARGDVAGERAALEQGLAHTRQAVLNDGQKKARADLDKRLHGLPAR